MATQFVTKGVLVERAGSKSLLRINVRSVEPSGRISSRAEQQGTAIFGTGLTRLPPSERNPARARLSNSRLTDLAASNNTFSVTGVKFRRVFNNLHVCNGGSQNPAYRLIRLFSISYRQSHGCLTSLPNDFPPKF